MNKTLKDIVVKSKTMSGYCSAFVPGWDCHGLPIEHQVMKALGAKGRSTPKVELRKECRAYAGKFVNSQREEFKRLAIFGDWERPYRTMDYSYQAQIIREFGKIVEKGFVYRARRAIHWCISCQTALAEAEIEYENHESPSVFVKYPITSGWEEIGLPKVSANDRYALIWTTTPWTLPASMAIAFHPSIEYVVVETGEGVEQLIIARALLDSVKRSLHLEKLNPIATIKGASLASLVAKHPFVEREIKFFPGEHVTTEAGTGLVHTAPGHGEEDFELGLKYGLRIYCPVLGDGTFESDVEHFAGLNVFSANPKIVAHLKSIGRLLKNEVKITHSYPHCWRCKNPVIFRATEQWFLKMSHENLRQKALEEIDRVKWVPAWGRDRIYNMIANRPDWCLSRQRTWGVPVVAFVCKQCHEQHLSVDGINRVADMVETAGADIWFEKSAKDLMPPGTTCAKCKGSDFEKGSDILDVWFDAGASYAAVVEKRDELLGTVDLYLEGSDQHRGWFHSTLLESVATRGKAPYKSVITHGFVVDGQGKKMSKSVGNYISAQDIIKQKGAEMLRLWVATEDYRDDVRLSQEILDRVTESYRRIRNTARYCLGNIFDFQPDTDFVSYDHLARPLDRWALDRLQTLVQRVRNAYDTYEFHLVVSALNDFCVVDLSAWYLDISKDCLYCDSPKGMRRRSAQTVLFEMASTIAQLLAPILPVTAEEIWDYLPSFSKKAASVHLTEFPKSARKESEDLVETWDRLLLVRGEVLKALERLRQQKQIGQSLEAEVELVAPPALAELLKAHAKDLAMLCIVSRAKLVTKLSAGMESFESTEVPGLIVGARPIGGQRCERCWTYASDIGSNTKHPSLCARCAEVVE
jgi:isoleucyl-tRNA synthetase